MISIQKLNKAYGKTQILFDINLDFERGNIYGIVGRNGAGKTTLFKCIAGLLIHTGTIISELQPLKNYLGYLQTEPYFFSKITGREYLQLLLNSRQLPWNDLDLKNLFDLPLDQYASTYSTGMKKKLAITAILLQQNEVFIMDEPFNGVDIQSNIIIQQVLQKLRLLNKTILLSSHIFSTLKDSCDHILLLDQGRIIKSVNKDGFESLEHELQDVEVDKRVEKMFE
ncbi:MAG: ABC transporter ATP-binding protein [Saprospiraceae bacterium]